MIKQVAKNNVPLLKILLAVIILFQVFFLIDLFCYYNVITINMFFKPISYDYWNWFLIHKDELGYDSAIANITIILKYMLNFLFLYVILNILFTKEYRHAIGKRIATMLIGFAIIIYMICFFYIKYVAEHYRLFMELISTEILSLLLLCLIIIIKRRLRNDNSVQAR